MSKIECENRKTVTIYSACNEGSQPGHRFLSYKDAHQYMLDGGLAFCCFGKDGIEYFMEWEEYEKSIDYAKSMDFLWPVGWEPKIIPITVPVENFRQIPVDGELYDVVATHGRVQVSRHSDGLYLGSWEGEGIDAFAADKITVLVNGY